MAFWLQFTINQTIKSDYMNANGRGLARTNNRHTALALALAHAHHRECVHYNQKSKVIECVHHCKIILIFNLIGMDIECSYFVAVF